MTNIEQLTDLLKTMLPSFEMSLDASDSATGTTWVDLKGPTKSLTVEVRPAQGYGLHLLKDDDAGFDGPAETYTQLEPLFARLQELSAV